MNNFTGSWTVAALESMAGKPWTNVSDTTGQINLVPANPSTGVDVLTIGSSFSYKIKYGGIDQHTFAVSVQPQKNSWAWINSGTLAAFSRVSGNTFICGAIARNTAAPRIDVVNLGRSGSDSAYWSDNTSTARALNCLPVLGAEVVGINQAIGDWGDTSGVTTAQFKTNKKVYIDKIIAYGGIPFLIAPHPTPDSIAAQARRAAFIDIDYELADEYGCALFDLSAHMGNDYANMTSSGFTWNVSSHPSAAGYADFANFIGAGLMLLAA
jgi:lysophospholipase L1-like esterase